MDRYEKIGERGERRKETFWKGMRRILSKPEKEENNLTKQEKNISKWIPAIWRRKGGWGVEIYENIA